jgi:Flp pilus assembly protein TadD
MTTMQARPYKFPALLAAASCALLALAACEPQRPPTLAEHQAATDGRTAGAAQQQEATLAELEQAYKADSGNQEAAVNYARALREAGRFERARLIVTPFAQKGTKASVPAQVEAASIQAALGNYLKAEGMARKAVPLDPDYGPAYHVLGIALDAQGLHDQAETAFRKALDHWEGNPSPVLNNLGLNLAAAGFIDEALQTLRKAQSLDPGRVEIERNIRIVSALQLAPPMTGTQLVAPPPKPGRKPGGHAG